jgi:T5SS/PEP-CTERM-associated repeat protein
MRPHPAVLRPSPRQSAIAAAAALLLGGGLPAQAQYFSYTGDPGAVSTLPVDLIPTLDGSVQTYDWTGSELYVGNGVPGSFSALAGAQLTVGYLGIGNSQTGTGTVTVGGGGTLVKLNAGSGTRLDVGSWGTATLDVSGGAKLDAASTACPDGSCYTFIGNAAGSFATLNVTGAGSEVGTRSIIVGQSSVFTNPPSTFVFGTQGGTTNAFVNVTAGGTLRTENAVVGSNNAGPDGNGNERANGTVSVTGVGSQWIVSPPSGGGSASLNIGDSAGGTGTVTVGNSGLLRLDGGAGLNSSADLSIGSNGGKGTLTVTGPGSALQIAGDVTSMQVGNSGIGAQGSFSVLAGASASVLFLNVGRDGATGSMTIDGVGSTLTQSGVGTNQAPFSNGAAFAHIGRNQGGGGGTGTVELLNGGQWIINDGGGDGRTAQYGPGVIVGRGAGSTGSLTISGAGSVLSISSSTLNPGVGVGDNYNPFVGIGYDNAATTSGTMTIDTGGKLLIAGNALSTPTNPRGTTLSIGGHGGGVGQGTVTVDGLGSEILISGYDASINVGRLDGSTGVLNVQNKALVTTTSMAAGIGSTGAAPGPNKATGTVNIDNAKILLSGARTDGSNVGAGMTVGRGTNGVGALNLSNGAQLQINSTAANGGMSIGGDQFLGGGKGTVTMTGGSSIVSTGQTIGINVGWSGVGLVDLSGASFIDLGAGSMSLAGVPNVGQSLGNGTMKLASGSKATANAFNIGGNSDAAGAVGGTATVTVSGLGSELKADGATGFIGVGRGGTGTLTVDDGGTVSAIVISVGRNGGNGAFSATDATVQLAGQQTTGNLTGPAIIIGQGGGTGTMNMLRSTMSIQNALANGNNGASLNVGGTPAFPGGSGTLDMTDSQITVSTAAAAAAPATVNIGRSGTGHATLNNSSITVSDGTASKGSFYVARDAGSTGTLTLNGGSSVTAGFVGVGVSAAGVGKNLGAAGGTGTLDLGELGSEGTVFAPRFELGAGSTLMGSGTIEAGPGGQVVIGGTIDVGRSPGRIRIRCDVTMLFGSQLILEIDGDGADVDIDQLVIGDDSTFDLRQLQIIFAFVGDTNPETVNLDLNEFLRAETPQGEETSLAALFGKNGNAADWGSAVSSDLFAFQSSVYDVTSFNFNPETGRVTGVEASQVPEPATYALVLVALALMARRRRWAAATH